MTTDKYGRDIDKIQHQIEAGTIGRIVGHRFEKEISDNLAKLKLSEFQTPGDNKEHILKGDPASLLLRYIINSLKFPGIIELKSWWFGGLATARSGDKFILDGKEVKASKSDMKLSALHFIPYGVSFFSC